MGQGRMTATWRMAQTARLQGGELTGGLRDVAAGHNTDEGADEGLWPRVLAS